MQMLPNSMNSRLDQKGVPLRALSSSSVIHLFADGEEGVLYDLMSPARLFSDTGGTVPIEVGDPVAFVKSSVPGGLNATQATVSQRPTYVVAANGDRVLQNDEIDDAMSVTLPDMGTACTVAYVTQSEVRLEEGVTLNGAYTLPQIDLLGFMAIDRALTTLEKVQLVRHLASFANGVVYGVDIDAMTLACLNAVDVCVYDTTKDSDGGAWTSNTAGLGPELVTNGDFATDTAWTDQLGTSIGGTVAITGGELVITQGSNSVWMGASQAIDVTGIDSVIINADRTAVSAGGVSKVGLHTSAAATGTPNIGFMQWLSTETGAKTITLDVSAHTTVYLLVSNGSSVSNTSNYDNISVKEVDYSWHWEELNTATRGATRPFPAQALIVAETAKVTIYDATDPDLPMWMVFNPAANNIIRATLTGVSALNGALSIGNGIYGLGVVRFLADDAYVYRDASSATLSGYYTGTISARNDNIGWDGTDPLGLIVDDTVNDVAMTVLDDAPIDAATGLQVPTIKVGTAGGLSVIQDDGTVVDSLATLAIEYVDASEDGVWWACPANGHIYFATWADIAAGDGFGDLIAFTGGGYSVDPLATGNTGLLLTTSGELVISGSNTSGTAKPGLMIHAPNYTDQTKGMSARITSTYNTGWMHGDIKGAWLSSTDDTDLTDTPLNANSDFASAATGWSVVSGPTFGTGTATFSAAEAASLIYPATDVTTEGQQFHIRLVVDSISTGYVGPSFASGTVAAADQITTAGTYDFVGVVTSNNRVYVRSANSDAVISEFSVRLADADRSVNNNGLATYGTVSRDPVSSGADLMAYSGFSASNYFSQPYNSDLDFGTGDFHVMGWVDGKKASYNCFVNRTSDKSTASGLRIMDSGLSTILVTGYGNNLAGGSYPTDAWFYVCFVRSGGVGYTYINGFLAASGAWPTSVTDPNATTTFGGYWVSGSLGAASPDLALWRISATAPTAEQIAKIYNDELPLFQENAACTLYGASDAVTALAHDPDTDLLHVGTSAGRSVFNGLERVTNTTTSVSTAISASGGLIGEK